MAVVTTKDKDSKYSHLTKIYSKQDSEEIVLKESDEKIEFKKEIVPIDRMSMLTSLAILTILFLLGTSGYLISRFL